MQRAQRYSYYHQRAISFPAIGPRECIPGVSWINPVLPSPLATNVEKDEQHRPLPGEYQSCTSKRKKTVKLSSSPQESITGDKSIARIAPISVFLFFLIESAISHGSFHRNACNPKRPFRERFVSTSVLHESSTPRGEKCLIDNLLSPWFVKKFIVRLSLPLSLFHLRVTGIVTYVKLISMWQLGDEVYSVVCNFLVNVSV